MFYKMTDSNKYGQFEIDSKQEGKIEEIKKIIVDDDQLISAAEDLKAEREILELSNRIGVSIKTAKEHFDKIKERKKEEEFIEQKAIELSSAMGVSVEYARGHIMEAMREHSPEEKARYKKELEERRRLIG